MNKSVLKDLSFGEWVRQRRHILDLTQQEFADQVGCARITLRRIEAGTLKPSKELAQLLLEKLDAPPTKWEAWLGFARGFSGYPERPGDSGENQPHTNLPTLLTSFIGRKKEQDEVVNLISKNRLVTLAGAGGMGKTRVSLQVGRKLLNSYPDGVWYVTFDSLSDPSLVPQTVAAVFDIREGSDRPVIETLTNVLRRKTALLILDNCEHLLDACSQLIMTLLLSCPNLNILTTSRETLNIEGESTYYLLSLSIPEHNEAAIEKLIQYESIHLFTERAGLVQSSFQLTSKNASVLTQICQRLDGIPLAIELAAARVDILQLDEILRQLNLHFDLLFNTLRGAIPRHQAMRASLDWSWELLDKGEQRFMRQLSVFSGGWMLESAQAVCHPDVLNLVSALVKKSLIIVQQESGSETRYHFHEVVRQYAREKLVEAGEEESICTRHLNYFLKLSEQAAIALRGPEQVEWLALLTDERDNIRAALTWADKTDVEGGLYLAGRLGRFWNSFDIREESYWLSTFLHKPESQAYPKARAMALHAHLRVLNLLNQIDVFHSTAKECIELYRLLGNASAEMEVALIMAGETSNPAQRIQLFQQALNLAQASGDIWKEAKALHEIGWNSSASERLACWGRAIMLFRQVGDWRSLAHCLCTTGYFALLDGDLELAHKSLDEATSLNDRLKDKETMIALYDARAQMYMMQSDYDQARAYWKKGLDITEELGARLNSLWYRSHLGYLALYEGNLPEARDTFSQTLIEFFNDKSELGVAFNLDGMAGVYIATGKFETAARLIGWADVTREKINDPRAFFEQAAVDKIIESCLSKLGESEFLDAYEKGQKMTLDEAVKYALREY